jgi:hypothetical protein
MEEKELIKHKLRQLDNIKESLQGKTHFLDRFFTYIIPVCFLVYCIYLDFFKEIDESMEIFVVILASIILYTTSEIASRNKDTNKRIDTVIQLLELEELANQKYSEEIQAITQTSQKNKID